jgi:amino acid adenylation domain-containing protein
MVAVMPCLHQLFEAQVARTPQAPAVVFEGQVLTYAELDARANRLARHLARLGVGPDAIVGLRVERSLELVVGILGVLKAGGAYLPIDTSYPEERVAYMVADAGAKVVLSADFDWSAEGQTQGAAPALPLVKPENLAYVIYTSGSTGKPKGVAIEHRNIVNYTLGVIERLRLEPGMRYATVSTIAADLGNTVIFPSLASGGCLHLISQERAQNGALLAEYFAREHIDVLKIVPSHFAALNPEKVMPRKRLILGGEASRLDWIAQLRALKPRIAPELEIYNHYGPTETTVGVLTYHLKDLPSTPSGTLPLGKPLPGVKVELLDGEICISGAGVARGYLNRPELTAEKFAGGVYRTGDRGRVLPDGSIEFCGRIDHQVKVHGYRVELGEIEAALREHDSVREAVVLLREEQLVAYVSPQDAAPGELRERLKGALPPYMVPSVFMALERLPLNANGKIDRQALAALPLEKSSTRPIAAPQTDTQKALVAIWRELLQAEVGIDDDVFDLGAHSLMAMKALTQIRDRFDVSLSLRNLFEHPTIAGLAEVVDRLWLTQQPKTTTPAQGAREEFVL